MKFSAFFLRRARPTRSTYPMRCRDRLTHFFPPMSLIASGRPLHPVSTRRSQATNRVHFLLGRSSVGGALQHSRRRLRRVLDHSHRPVSAPYGEVQFLGALCGRVPPKASQRPARPVLERPGDHPLQVPRTSRALYFSGLAARVARHHEAVERSERRGLFSAEQLQLPRVCTRVEPRERAHPHTNSPLCSTRP